MIKIRKITKDDVRFLQALRKYMIQYCREIKGKDCTACRWYRCSLCPINTTSYTIRLDRESIDKLEGFEVLCESEESQENKETADEKYYDKHYCGDIQPIEFMQANFSKEEFIGFAKGNIQKYLARLGKKDDPIKEIAKMRRYLDWLEQAYKGETINPRE